MCFCAQVKFLGSNDPEDPKCDDSCRYDIKSFGSCGEVRSDSCTEQVSRTLADVVYAPLSCWEHIDVMVEQRKHFWDSFLCDMTDPTNRLHEKWVGLDQDVQGCILTFWSRLKSMAKSDWDRKFGGMLDDFRVNRALYQDPCAEVDSSIIRFVIRFINTAKNAVADDGIVVPHMPLARQPWEFTSIFGNEAPGVTAANNATNGQYGTPQHDAASLAMVPASSGPRTPADLSVVRDGLVPPTQERYSEEPHSFQPRQPGSDVYRPGSQLPPGGAQPSGVFPLSQLSPPTTLPTGTQMATAPCNYNQPPFPLPLGTLSSQPPAQTPPPAPVSRAALDWLARRHLYPFQLLQNSETGALTCIQWGTHQMLGQTETAGATPYLQNPSAVPTAAAISVGETSSSRTG